MTDTEEFPEITLRGEELKLQRKTYIRFYKFMERRTDLETFGQVLAAWANNAYDQAVMRVMHEAARIGHERGYTMSEVEEILMSKSGEVTVRLFGSSK